jgi:fumarate reductase subunit D
MLCCAGTFISLEVCQDILYISFVNLYFSCIVIFLSVVLSLTGNFCSLHRILAHGLLDNLKEKVCLFVRSPSLFYLLTVGVEFFVFHLITLRHTPQSVGLLWTRDRPVAGTST